MKTCQPRPSHSQVECHVCGDKGPIAKQQKDLFILIFWVAAFVFIAVEGALIYLLVKYRYKNDKLPYQSHGNTRLEIIWTIVPAIVLAFIAVPTIQVIWDQQNGVPDDLGEPLRVEAIGHQWWFEFRYPDLEIVTANELYIPINRPINIKLQSEDVIHSFWIPKLGGKLDMVPLNDNYMWLLAEETGIYYGQCAEFCGVAHALMRFRAIAETEQNFETWVEGMRTESIPPHAAIPGLDLSNWKQLCELSQKERNLVLKVSGFSELAWGSRGLHIGNDLSQANWANAVNTALEDYENGKTCLNL